MKFAELTTGRRIELGPVEMTEAEILEFAGRYDPQWFHTDPERAKDGLWGGLIASGWHTCAVSMGLVVRNVLEGSESFGSPGLEYLKWTAPVRPGDRIRVVVEVLDQRTSQSKPDLGIVRWRWIALNQNDEQVLDITATSLFKLPV